MSGQPNPFPKPKVTIKQWMIFVAVLAVFNYLAVLVVQTIPPNRFSAEQFHLRTAVAFLVMNGLVIGYGFFLLILGWWSRVYRHKRGLPDPPLRTVVWQVVNGLCVTVCFALRHPHDHHAHLHRATGMGVLGLVRTVCLAALTCLSFGLFAWAAKKTVGKATEETQAVDDPLDTASHPT